MSRLCGIKHLLLFTVILMTDNGVNLAGVNMDASSVLQRIRDSEKELRDIQCNLRWYEVESGQVYRESEWGYENGKEFVTGLDYAKNGEGDFVSHRNTNAFDGKAMRSYTYVAEVGDSRGGIYGYDPLVFAVPPSPRTLLGYTIEQEGIYTLSELLSDRYVKNISLTQQEKKGVSCIVLEAIGFQTRRNKPIYDLRVWIDPSRGYRPLTIEKYISSDDPNSLAGLRGERWTYLKKKIDIDELKQIHGIWFPIAGEKMLYTIVPEFTLQGKSEDDIRKENPDLSDEELAKAIKLVNRPFHARKRVEFSDIVINRGIDPEKFTIRFPLGCKVWDDFASMGYTVGGPDSNIDKDIADDNMPTPGLAQSTDVGKTSEEKPTQEGVFLVRLQKFKKFAATFFEGSGRPDCSAILSGLTLA